MICPKCGKVLSDTAKFCSGCGSKVEAEQPAEIAPDYGVSSENAADAFSAQETADYAQSSDYGVPTGNIADAFSAQETADYAPSADYDYGVSSENAADAFYAQETADYGVPTGNIADAFSAQETADYGQSADYGVPTGNIADAFSAQETAAYGQSADYGVPTGNIADAFHAQETAAYGQSADYGVPSGNVVTGTLPAQDAAATTTATLPEMTNVLQAETVKPEKKKFSPKKLIAVGAAAAGVVVAGVVASGLTFAKADFAHTFMGNKKYATAVMGQQIEQVVNIPGLTGSLSAAANSMSYDDSSDVLTSYLGSIKSSLPESGAEIEFSVSADLSDDILEEFADNLDCDTDKAEEILEAVKNLKVRAGVQFSEDGIALTAAGTEQGNDLIKVNALYDAESEAYYVTVPGVSDECLMFADDDAVIDMEALNSQNDTKATKKMLEDVLKAYKDSLDDAEIVYEKTTFSIGDVEFKGKMSSVTLEDEALADMLTNVSEEFFDSEFAEALGDVDEIQDEVDSLISELEDVDSIKVVIDNFMNSNNTVAGLRVGIEVKNSGSKAKAEIAYLNCKDGIACNIEVDGENILEFSQEKESKSAGKYTGKISDGYSSGKFTIDYENYREKKMLGQNVALGDYTIKFSGDMFDSEDLPFEKLTIKLSDEDNKLNYEVSAKIEGSTVSAKMVLSEGISEAITAESMNISEAYDAMSESDKDKVNGFYTKLLEYMADKTKDSEFFTSVPVNDGTLADELQATAKRALRETELASNYAGYNESTMGETLNMASRIYSRVSYVAFPSTSQNSVKVKAYYDKNGKFSVLDNAGMSSIDSALQEQLAGLEYKSAYVEIVVWPGRGPVCGVNVVMTDDSSNIPENLPDAYNFFDQQYKWGSDEDVNYVGSFIVGTYPRLANGEGGQTKAADEELAAKVKTYSADAEKAAKAMSSYTGLSFTNNKTSYIDFSISNGKWKYYTYGGARINGDSTAVSNYLTEKVGAVGAKHICFYYEGSKLIGAIASDKYYYSYFAVDDFKSGKTEIWSYMDGVIGGNVVGTSPSLTKMTSLPQDYLDEMVGTWLSGDEFITLSADDLKNITFSINRNGASINNIYIQSADKGNFYFYPNNGEPYISDGWYRYTKI